MVHHTLFLEYSLSISRSLSISVFNHKLKYIRKYLPQLSKFPTEYIYEPWKAPLGIQRQAGCIIGVDYPAPIVDHEEARKKNLEKMKIAYSIGRKGSDGGSGSSKSHSGSAMKRKHHEEELY